MLYQNLKDNKTQTIDINSKVRVWYQFGSQYGYKKTLAKPCNTRSSIFITPKITPTLDIFISKFCNFLSLFNRKMSIFIDSSRVVRMT